jgi:O-antigen ligase
MSDMQPPADAPPPYQPPAGSAPPYGAPQPAAADRPKLVDIAFWLYIAAAALSILGLLVSLASIGAVREQALRQLEQQGQGELPPEAVEGAIWAGFAIGLVIALVVTAAYVVFAILMRKGRGWARIVLAVFAGLAIFGVVGGFGIGALQFLCLAAATVLVFLPASNEFFKASAQRRAPRTA